MMLQFISRKRTILFYGTALAFLLLVLQWLKMRLIVLNHSMEVYIGSIALIFTLLGAWAGLKLTAPKSGSEKTRPQTSQDTFVLNEAALLSSKITRRELQVLELMAKGLSNREIAERLFLSLSTVKSHGNSLFDKLGVKRRTQAVEEARTLGIIP